MSPDPSPRESTDTLNHRCESSLALQFRLPPPPLSRDYFTGSIEWRPIVKTSLTNAADETIRKLLLLAINGSRGAPD